MNYLLYICKDKKNVIFITLLVFLPLLYAVVIYIVIKVQLGGFILTMYEKKAINNLTMYHKHSQQMVKSYFRTSADSLEAMTKISSKADIETSLLILLETNPQFLTVGTIDSNGIFTRVLSRFEEVHDLKGQNMSDRDYYQGTMRSKKTYIGQPIVGSKSSITQIAMCAPKIQNNIVGEMYCGFISLTDLTKAARIFTPFYATTSTLVDDRGFLLIGDIKHKDQLLNVIEKDPFIRKLSLNPQETLLDEGYGWDGKKVLKIGEKFFIEGRKMYLVSHLDKSGQLAENKELNLILDKTTLFLAVIWFFISSITVIFLAQILNKQNGSQ